MKIDKLVIIAIIILISGGMIIFFSVLPKYQEYTYLESQLSEIQTQYANGLDYYKSLADTISKIESDGEFIEKVNSALPSTDSTSEIISFLQNESAKNNLSIQSMSFSKVSKLTNTDIKNIGFTIELYGEYGNFKKFVNSLDNSSRIFQVTSISFESQRAFGPLYYSDPEQDGTLYKMEIITHSY